MPAFNDISVEGSEIETQSLESIVGDVSQYVSIDQDKVSTRPVQTLQPSITKHDPSLNDVKLASSKSNKKYAGHFLSKGPAESAPDQRIGTTIWSNLTSALSDNDTDYITEAFLINDVRSRGKRDVDEDTTPSPRRRRVRVRVPVQKRINIDEDLTPSEAQRAHEITPQDVLQTQDAAYKNIQEYGTRKIKIIRKKTKNEENEENQEPQERNPTPPRRRVAVRRRRPTNTDTEENIDYFPPTSTYDLQTFSSYQPEPLTTQSETTHKRRRVLVTKKRPLLSTSFNDPSIVPTHSRRRIVITKKRPIKKQEVADPLDPFRTLSPKIVTGMTTLYDYRYSVPAADQAEKMVTVSQLFLSGQVPDDAYIPEYDVSDSYSRFDSPSSDVDAGETPVTEADTTAALPETTSQVPTETQSFFWFYEPSDSYIIDVVPTTTLPDEKTSSHVPVIPEVYEDNYTEESVDGSTGRAQHKPEAHFEEQTSTVGPATEIPLLESSETPTIEPSTEIGFDDKNTKDSSIHGETQSLELSETSINVEETSQYDGPPRFVRPTRFSVTRKPTKPVTSYPGRRRKPVYSESTTPDITTTTTKPSYRYRKTNTRKNKYSSSNRKFTKSTARFSSTPVVDKDVAATDVVEEDNIKPTKSADLVTNTPDSMPSTMKHESSSAIVNSPSSSLETEPFSSSSSETVIPLKSELSPDTVNAMLPTTDISYTTKVVTSTRLRTYTYLVTRVNGDESITASSTTVKPAVKTLTLTLPVANTVHQQQTARVEEEGRGLGIAEARYNLATKVMSNGVEVIVAGDKSTLPGEPEVLRVLPTSLSRPITLAPSTLTDHMLMLLPQGNQNMQDFVTKTYLTTYTYLTTLLQDGVTVVSSNEKIISNVLTEELKATPIMPTSATQMTLSSSPSLATGVFHTTYTYLNTLVDGEVPLVVTSKKTVSNTVTAPEDYMSMLQPSEPVIQDTNTYLSTVAFTKTLNDGLDTKVVSTEDVLTQVIITETDSKPSSVDIKPTPTPLTTDVVKTYFVTYTYYSTMLDGDNTVVRSEVATSSDVVTEKFILTPKRTSTPYAEKLTSEMEITAATDIPSPMHATVSSDNSINVYATKTYLTTFTYFTTLLQDNSGKTPTTVIKSRTKVVQNIVTEVVDTNLLNSEYLLSLRSSLNSDRIPIVATATLNDGQQMEITAMQDGGTLVKPTTSPLDSISSSFEETMTANKNNVVTGSTIIFFDENDQIDSTVPSSSSSRTLAIEVAGHTKISASSVGIDNKPTDILDELLSVSESVQESTQALPLIGSLSSEPVPSYTTSILTASTVTKNGATLRPGDQVIMLTNSDGNITMIPVSDPVTKHPDGTTQTGIGSDIVVGDLLNLGSFGINGLNALGPVFNAMAGLIQSNLNSDVTFKKNETVLYPVTHKPKPLQVSSNPLLTYAGPKPPPIRSPIYIPVGGLAADSVAEESQNVEGYNVFTDTDQRTKPQVILGRPTMESPLLAGGIPISPGQVITANSDVIIGKPAILGPRPPDLGKPYNKNEVPIGMKPPPLPPPPPPQSPPHKIKPAWPVRDQNGHYIPFNHQHRVPNPNMESHPHFHIHRRPVGGVPQKHQQINGDHHHIPLRDHSHNYDTIHYTEEFERHPDIPISVQQPHHYHHHHHHHVEIPGRVPPNNLGSPSNVPHTRVKPGSDAHYTEISENIQHYQQVTGINIPISPGVHGNIQYRPDTRDEYLFHQPTKQEYNDVVPHLRPPSFTGQHYINQNIPEYENVPIKESVPENIPLKPRPNKPLQPEKPENEIGYVNPIQHQPILLPDSPEFLDHSTVNPLLVNIQPSQVANVIIPHGSSTALIYSGEPAEHSQKGEIFNDPSPYPDAEVDHVVDALSTARPPHEGEGVTQAALLPSNAIQMDVPVGPHGINVATGQQKPHPVFVHDTQTRPPIQDLSIPTYHKHQLPGVVLHQAINTQFHENHQVIKTPPSRLEFMTPPPPPRPDEPTDDYIFGEEPTETEGGEVVQESNARPLRPGQLPIELTITSQPSTSMPIDPIDDMPLNRKPENKPNLESDFNTKPDGNINFSVVNSKPVQLEGNNPSINPPAIINGKPGLTTFGDNAQATVSIGSPTKLKPEFMGPGELTDEEKQEFNHNDRPIGTNLINPPPHKVLDEHSSPFDTPIHVKPLHVENHKMPSEYDNIVYATNVKEKLPSPFDVRPQQRPTVGELDLAVQGNIPRPFSKPNLSQFDRNSQSQEDTVVGLQPPPQILNIPQEPSIRPTGNPPRRPVPSQRIKPRPPPPYKFEIPPPPPSSIEPIISATTKPKLPDIQRVPEPIEVLSPPKPADSYYNQVVLFDNKPSSSEKPHESDQWLTPTTYRPVTTRPDSINPVLGGVLTVEDSPQKSEVITADSKVVLTNVIKGHRHKPEGIRITGSQPALQTVVIGKPVPEISLPDIDIMPTTVKTPTKQPEWNNGIIVGSETIIEEDVSTQTTPEIAQHSTSKGATKSEPTSVLVTSGVTTIFGNLFTKPTETQKTIEPTKSTTQNYHSVISVIVEPDYSEPEKEDGKKENKLQTDDILKSESSNVENKVFADTVTVPIPTTFVVTHTKTLTVTTTETSVEKSVGKEPSTHTLVLTKTQTSTVLDTVTEIHTLVKPTNILATVTTTSTLPQVTSTVYTTSDVRQHHRPATAVLTTTDKIITEEKPKPVVDSHENESIFVVMTDKKPGTVKIHALTPPDTDAPPPEIQVPDETNEITPNVLLGGILTHSTSDSECRPECKASRNELCQKLDNVMRCVCRPGFARMFPDRPCKPTYTYTMRLTLDHYGKEKIQYTDSLQDVTSTTHQHLAEATREGLDRMVMQSDLRDIYHGVAISGFEPAKKPDNVTVKFYVQLSENTEESRLQDVLVKSLRSNNFSLGGTDVFASKENIQYLQAEDFDECADHKFHDCSEDAQCFNLRGTYTCSCKEGFTDLSPNTLFPGRVCSAEQIGCEQCSYHGTCYTRNDVEIVCECFQWYAGDHCQINLKVLLLILVTVGACLMVLLVVCLILACMKRRDHHHSGPPPLRPGVGFRRYKDHGTGDKRAMISLDTSSEGSVERTPPPYIKQAAINAQRQKVMRKAGKGPAPMAPPLVHTHSGTMDQRDRSLTVMIPRAKYRAVPVQPTNTLLTMSTFGPEQKLINYLTPDGTNTPEKHGSRSTSRKPSNSTNHSESRHRKTSSQSPAPRKPSTGALVSAGFEVSATVGRTKELDESFIAEAHTDLSQQGFNTIRTAESSIIVDIPPPPTLEAELEDVIAKVDRLTVSEARSYDETTIHPPTKSLHRDYDSTKHSSSHHANNDEGHTMVERDLGSTFMMPQTHLFKPDRGSDVSNFDSL